MPTIPAQTGPTVTPAGATGQYQTSAATPEAFGAGVGRGLQQFGGVIEKHAEAMMALNDETAAKDADIAATKALSNLQYNPESGFLTKQGKAAVDTYQGTVDAAEKIRRDIVATLPNDRARKGADQVIARRVQGAVESMALHTAVEGRKWQVDTSKARALSSIEAASLDYMDDAKFNQGLATAKDEAVQQGQLEGLPPEMVKIQQAKYQDTAWTERLRAWRIHDPVGALEAFQKNAEQITSLHRETLGHQLFMAAAPVIAREIADAGGVGVLPSPVTDKGVVEPLPRGIRNNNPGNIIRTETKWQGEIQGGDSRYASFDSPEAGVRAMGKTFISYSDKYGINTVQDVVSRWAPSTENDTQSYIKTVSKVMGVKPDEVIDIKNPATMAKLSRAIIDVENGPGGARVTDAQIKAGLDAAVTGKAVAPTVTTPAFRDPSALTGNEVVDGLPPDYRIHVMDMAKTIANKQQAQLREVMKDRLKDTQAELLANGQASNPPTFAEVISAYGQVEGPQIMRNLREAQSLGTNLQQVKTLSNTDLDALEKSTKPLPGDGFADRTKQHQILVQAINHTKAARHTDPVQYAIDIQQYGVAPMTNVGDAKAVADELLKRTSAVGSISRDYGTAPTLFTKGESKAIAATVRGLPVENQKQYLASLYTGTGSDMPAYKLAMQSIAPDAPVIALAGIYQARGLRTTDIKQRQATDVSDLILRGNAILNPPPKEDGTAHMGGKSLIKMPEEKTLLADWNSVTGTAFVGKERAADLFQQTSRTIYASLSAEEGDYSGVYNSKRWKASIQLATGGISEHAGADIVLPYGMKYDQFADGLKRRADKLAPTLGVQANELTRLPLENVGDGRYIIRRGTGYLVDKSGRPVEFDFVTDLPGPQPSAPPEAGMSGVPL